MGLEGNGYDPPTSRQLFRLRDTKRVTNPRYRRCLGGREASLSPQKARSGNENNTIDRMMTGIGTICAQCHSGASATVPPAQNLIDRGDWSDWAMPPTGPPAYALDTSEDSLGDANSTPG